MTRVRAGTGRGLAGSLRRTREDHGVGAALIARTPIAVVDVETTGLKAGDDRVVELCVVRLEPTEDAEWRQSVVLSTLINPNRPMGATHVHGIAGRDVQQAPGFEGIARSLVEALCGAVVAGWNAHFDVRFLQAEFAAAGLDVELPFVCSMRLRQMAGLGPPISLRRACEAHSIPLVGHHSAEADTVATAEITRLCLDRLRERGVERFKDLRKLRGFSFVKSFRHAPMRGDEGLFLPEQQPHLKRSPSIRPQPGEHPVMTTDPEQITEEQWKQRLDPEAYRVLRQSGTERAFTGEHLKEKRLGTFGCRACGTPLFRSNAKFESGCGWPSFFEPFANAIEERPDHTHGMVRTEVRCAACKSHLGHVFPDGPPPTGLRYCINSVCLDFEPEPAE